MSQAQEHKRAKVADSLFTVIFQKSLKPPKSTIVVSKVVAKKAVDRNRIKRVIKEALRQGLYAKYEFKIIVKKNIADLKMQEVKEKLEKLLKI